MKKFLTLFISAFLFGDTIINTTVGCPDLKDAKYIEALLKKGVDVNIEIVKRGCRVFYPKEKVEARLDIGEKDGFLQVLFPKNEEYFYIKKKDIKIEQPGRKNILKF